MEWKSQSTLRRKLIIVPSDGIGPAQTSATSRIKCAKTSNSRGTITLWRSLTSSIMKTTQSFSLTAHRTHTQICRTTSMLLKETSVAQASYRDRLCARLSAALAVKSWRSQSSKQPRRTALHKSQRHKAYKPPSLKSQVSSSQLESILVKRSVLGWCEACLISWQIQTTKRQNYSERASSSR